MRLIDKLIQSEDNIEEVVIMAVNDQYDDVSKRQLLTRLKEHPNYGSLLSIYDTLSDLDIESVAIKCKDIKLVLLAHSKFIAQVRINESDLFTYIHVSKKDRIVWYNPLNHKEENIGINQLGNYYTGYSLIINPQEISKRHNEEFSHRVDRIQNIIDNILLLSLPTYFLISLSWKYVTNSLSLWSIFFVVLLLIGCMAGGLLLIHEYNEYNPITSNLCHKTQKLNCSAVLQSKGASVWGLSWSVIGTSYFMGLLMSLLITSFDQGVYVLTSILMFFALPYTLYSLFYQKVVLKQWCPLCLFVQFDIVSLFLLVQLSRSYVNIQLISAYTIITVAGILLISFLLVYFIELYLKQLKAKEYYQWNLKRIKYSPSVFQKLLMDEEEIPVSTDGFGLNIGPKDAKFQILKVCSPYCGHCAHAQLSIDKLLAESDNVNLKVVFTSNPKYEGYKRTPIDTFLSVYYEGKNIEKTLTDWFESKDNNLERFNKQHPVSEHFTERNNTNAFKMAEFCDRMQITGTPTIYINGHRLPNIYDVDDLRHVLL